MPRIDDLIERDLDRFRPEWTPPFALVRERRRTRRRHLAVAYSGTVVVIAASVVAGMLALNRAAPVEERVLQPATSTPTAVSVKCSYRLDPQQPSPAVSPPATDQTVPAKMRVELALTDGIVGIDLLPQAAPCTTASFRDLVESGFYNDMACHRLTGPAKPSDVAATSGYYVLQCGDPTGTGNGGPGYLFDDENLTGATYPAGTLAMANRGPDTNGSQFFLVYADSRLDPNYTPFGRVVSGLDVLQRIGARGSDGSNGSPGDGRPVQPVVITKATVISG